MIASEEYEELATYSIRGRQEVVCIIYDIPGPWAAARGSHYCINQSSESGPALTDGRVTLCSLAGQQSRDKVTKVRHGYKSQNRVQSHSCLLLVDQAKMPRLI